MSVLSPIAAAILGNLQANLKSDGKQDANAFISLLETNAQPVVNNDNGTSVVDTLYSKQQDDTPPPAAVPVDNYADKNQQAQQPQPDAVKQDTAIAPKAAAKDTPAPKERASDNNDARPQTSVKKDTASDTKQPRSLQSVRKAQADEKKPKNNDDDTNNNANDGATPADQIRAKIQQLNDILNLLASLPAGTQVSIVQVTQANTLTESQQNLGVVPVMADLSDRLKQLLSAVTTGQNLPPETQAALSKALGSFQDLVGALTQGTAGGAVDPNALAAQLNTTKATLNEVLQALQAPQDTTQPAAVTPATDLLPTLAAAPAQSLPVAATGDKNANADLNKDLQQLSQWIDDVQQIIAPKAKAPVAAGPKIADALSIPAGQNTPADLTTGKTNSDAAVANIVNAAAAATPAVVAPPVANNSALAAHVAAAAVENAAGSNGNLSGGSDQSGQGGDRAPAGALQGFAAPGAPTSTSETTASFSKTLKAAGETSAPVAEQVAFNIKTAVKDGASKIQIQLDPVELGKLHIKIDMDSSGKASGIVVTADNKSTLELLQRDARGLQQALADAGIKAESGSLSFNLRGGDQGQQQNEPRQAANYAPVLPEEDELAPLAVVSRNYVVNLSDGLDIQI